MNKITIALCDEDRQLLEGLMGSVSLLASVIANAQPKDVQEKVITETLTQPTTQETVTPDEGHPVDAVSPHSAPEPAEERTDAAEKPAATQYTQADILAIVQRLIAPGSNKREQAKAIVNDYAVKISGIPVDKYTEVMDRLIKLEKEA